MIARRQIISGSDGPIFLIFAPNNRYLFVDDRSGPLFWFLKGRCHSNQLKSKKSAFFVKFVMLPFQNGLQFCNSDFKRLDRMNFSTLCTILVTFSPQTPEITLLTIAPFVAIWHKSAYHVKYLRMYWTYLDLLTGLVGVLVGMIIPIFVWWSPKGRCYGNQLKLEDVRRHHQEWPLCFGIRQWIGRS